MQAESALIAQVYFDGEYRIADGPWQQIVKGKHIPSTEGDVTLRGNFHMLTPDGEYVGVYSGDTPIALYTDHINLTGRNPLYASTYDKYGHKFVDMTEPYDEQMIDTLIYTAKKEMSIKVKKGVFYIKSIFKPF